jgi:large subunit ribosomal protein L29
LKVEEVRALSDAEIKKQIDDSDQALVSLSVRVASRQLVNHRELANVKKRVARLKTVRRERELGIR